MKIGRRTLLQGLTVTATGLQPARAAGAASDKVFEQACALAARWSRQAWTAAQDSEQTRLSSLDYDAQRQIRFRPEKALWRGEGLAFEIQFFHRAGGASNRVEMIEVAGSEETPVRYSPDLYEFGPMAQSASSTSDIGFAGLRIHADINGSGNRDEFCVFLGGTYFRAAGKGQPYGLSARALSINTGGPGQEEFPFFRSFWILKPQAQDRQLCLVAVSDSSSLCAAHRFVITPGETTLIEVESRIFARRPLTTLGLAPMSSMFAWGSESRRRPDDFRPEVHDSDGLLIHPPKSPVLWRPLVHPSGVQVSEQALDEAGPFGLLQRQRDFDRYLDLETRYDLRPDLWVEPLSSWGSGRIRLLEFAARGEWEDNIAALWRPDAPLVPGQPQSFRYRLGFGRHGRSDLAIITLCRSGSGDRPDLRRYLLEFDRPMGEGLTAEIRGETVPAQDQVLQPNPVTGGVRLSFQVPQGLGSGNGLRAWLVHDGQIASETWVQPPEP